MQHDLRTSSCLLVTHSTSKPWSTSAGHIGYALAPLIARGLMCGPEQQVILHMHDREAAAQNLSAVQMELDDLASDLLLSKMPSADGRSK